MHRQGIVRRSVAGVSALALSTVGFVVLPGVASAAPECTRVTVTSPSFSLVAAVGQVRPGTRYCLEYEALLEGDVAFAATDSGRADGDQDVYGAMWNAPTSTLVWTVPAARDDVPAPEVVVDTSASGTLVTTYDWADPVAPDAATGFVASEIGVHSAQVSWTAAVDNGTPVDGYRVQQRKHGTVGWTAAGTTTETRTTLGELDAGTTYDVRIWARAVGLEGETALEGTVTTLPLPPVDDEYDALADLSRTMDVLDNDPDGYAVAAISTPAEHGVASVVHGVVSYLADADYVGDDTFQYRVTGVDAPATVTVHVSAYDAPGVPGNVEITEVGETTIHVEWDASLAGSAAIDGYEVLVREPDHEVDAGTPIVDGTTADVTGLTPDTDYYVVVRAIDVNDHASAYTARELVTTDAVIPPAPLDPGITTVDAIATGGTATLTVSRVSDQAVVEAGELAVGVTDVTIDGLSVRITTRHGFSGVITQPLTVSDGGAPVDLDAVITVDPDASTRAAHTPTSATTSRVSWSAGAGATRYAVKVGGTTVCTTTLLACTVRSLLGPLEVVSVVALGNDGTASARRLATYATAPVSLGHVHFVGDSSVLTPSSLQSLRAMAARLATAGIGRLTIHGYTATQSSTTRSATQRRLSLQRADAVGDALTSMLAARGVHARIVLVAQGATHPIASNATYAGRAENRRAEVVIG